MKIRVGSAISLTGAILLAAALGFATMLTIAQLSHDKLQEALAEERASRYNAYVSCLNWFNFDTDRCTMVLP